MPLWISPENTGGCETEQSGGRGVRSVGMARRDRCSGRERKGDRKQARKNEGRKVYPDGRASLKVDLPGVEGVIYDMGGIQT